MGASMGGKTYLCGFQSRGNYSSEAAKPIEAPGLPTFRHTAASQWAPNVSPRSTAPNLTRRNIDIDSVFV